MLCKKQQEYTRGKDTISDLESSCERKGNKDVTDNCHKVEQGQKDKALYKMKCDIKRRERDQKRFLRDTAVSESWSPQAAGSCACVEGQEF